MAKGRKEKDPEQEFPESDYFKFLHEFRFGSVRVSSKYLKLVTFSSAAFLFSADKFEQILRD